MDHLVVFFGGHTCQARNAKQLGEVTHLKFAAAHVHHVSQHLGFQFRLTFFDCSSS